MLKPVIAAKPKICSDVGASTRCLEPPYSDSSVSHGFTWLALCASAATGTRAIERQLLSWDQRDADAPKREWADTHSAHLNSR